ncbi:MAG: MBG domain-containing protein [Amaricoccus sp.]
MPTGGQVRVGKATIVSAGGRTTVNQSTDRAVIDWQGFSVGRDSSITLTLPSAKSAVLNRVVGSATSAIAGSIQSNGQVYLVNPNGIAITRTGTVKVGGGFVASTLDISDEDFAAGRLRFSGKSGGRVSNAGTIAVGEGGLAGLLSNGGVDNSGVVSVPAGRVALGTGSAITLDRSGTGFMQILAPATSGEGGEVGAGGKLRANGGRIEIKASSAGKVVRDLVNLKGEANVSSIRRKGGVIVLDGGSGGVAVTGRLKASSVKAKGGTVRIVGKDIALRGARVDASGASGGTVTVGGGRQGAAVPGATTAETVAIDATSAIAASASAGRGGEVTVWSGSGTDFRGTITATGQEGDGGNAEVSSHGRFAYAGTTDLRSRGGRAGDLLLDPYNLTISSSADANQSGFTATGPGANVNATSLQNALATANVTVQTGSSGSENGDITVASPISWSANTTLTLNAAGAIALNAGITNSGTGSGFTLTAAGTSGISGSGTIANSGALAFNVNNASANGTLSGVISGTGSLTKAGTGRLTLAGGNSYTGATTVAAGTLVAGSSAAFGFHSATTVNGSATLDLAGNTIGTPLGSLAGSGTVTNSGTSTNTLGVGALNTSTTFSGVIQDGSGKVNLVKDGAGTLQLSGTNTYSGVTAVVDGTVQITGSGTLGAGNYGGAIALSSGGTLEYWSNKMQTFSGDVSGGGNLTKTGTSATLTLSGANTYTGTTTVTAGTIYLTGSWNLGSGTARTVVNSGGVLYTTGPVTAGTLSHSGPGYFWMSGNNRIDSVATTGTVGNFSLNNAKSLALGSISSTEEIQITASGATSDLTINPGATITSTYAPTPTAVMLGAGRNFVNRSGAAAVSAPNSRWLVYSAAPGGDTFNGLDSGHTAVWNTAEGGAVPAGATGNRYVFAARPTLTVTSANASKTYGTDATATVAASYGLSGFDAGVAGAYLADTAASVFSGTPRVTSSGSAATANAGSAAITAAQGSMTALSGYALSFASPGILTVNRAALTITGDTTTTYYNSLSHTNGITTSGLVNGDMVYDVAGRATATNAGTYADALSGATGFGLANYDITYVDGSLVIDKAALTINGHHTSTTYDGLAHANGFTATGLYGSDTVTAVTGNATGTSAGTYADALSGATGSGLSNYDISYVDGALAIGKAALTVTGDTTSVTYNGHVRTNGFTTSGLYGSDTVTAVTGNATGTSAGSYADALSGATGSGLSNYDISYVDGALAIGKAALTVTGDTTSVTYDGHARTNGFTTSGLLGSDSVTGVAGRATGTSAGTYADALSGATGSGLSNYDLSYVDGALTIGKAALTVTYTANHAGSTYGDPLSPVSGTVSGTGFVNGEGVGDLDGVAGWSTAASSGADVGRYAIAGSGLSSANYTIVAQQAAGNGSAYRITPAALTITAKDVAKAYDGTAFAGGNGVRVAGLVNGDTLAGLGGTLGYGGAAQGATNAGSYLLTASGLTSGNYVIAWAPGTLTVNEAALTITGNRTTTTYNGRVQTNGFTVTGLHGRDSVTGVAGLASGTGAGLHADALSGATGSGLSNYAIRYVDGALAIGKADLTVTAVDAHKTYDGQPWSGGNGVTYSGFKGSDTAASLRGTLAFGGSAQGAVDPGTYAITPFGVSGDNYAVTLVSGALTVAPGSAGKTTGIARPGRIDARNRVHLRHFEHDIAQTTIGAPFASEVCDDQQSDRSSIEFSNTLPFRPWHIYSSGISAAELVERNGYTVLQNRAQCCSVARSCRAGSGGVPRRRLK